jgi:hypothetical protein
MAAIEDKLDRQFEELRMLREEMRTGFAELQGELVAVHRQLVLVLTAFSVGLLGLLGAQMF